MVKKYIILANSSVGFEIPRQLTEINGEPLVKRTIRLLKENGIEDIIITSKDKRFDNLGAVRYEPLYNDYDAENPKSHWLKAFPIELMNEPTCYLFGDVYYSENAIKRIIKEDNEDILFFCSHNNECPQYIKNYDEPLAFKVHNFSKFKYHISRLIDMWEKNETIRRPITWELYRSINGIDVNKHKLTYNYIVINDESCDIDSIDDIIKLRKTLGGMKMIKCEAIEGFTLGRFDELKNIVRANNNKDRHGEIFVGDTFECDENMAKYLTGKNDKNKVVAKIIELKPVQDEEAIIPLNLDPERMNQLSKTIMEHIKTAPLKESSKTSKKKTSKK